MHRIVEKTYSVCLQCDRFFDFLLVENDLIEKKNFQQDNRVVQKTHMSNIPAAPVISIWMAQPLNSKNV